MYKDKAYGRKEPFIYIFTIIITFYILFVYIAYWSVIVVCRLFFSPIVNMRAFLGLPKKESAARWGGVAWSLRSRGFPFSAVDYYYYYCRK